MGPESPDDPVEIGVKQVLISMLDLPLQVADLDDGLSLYSDSIGLDSLTLLHAITRIEQRFSCEIDDEAIMSAELTDVGSLVDLIRTQLTDGPSGGADTAAAGQGTGK
jgi:acyl carrier protein